MLAMKKCMATTSSQTKARVGITVLAAPKSKFMNSYVPLRAITDDLKTAQNIADKLFTVKTPAKSYAKKNQ